MRNIFVALMLFTGSVVLGQDYSSTSKKAIREFEKAKEFFQYKNDAEAEALLWQTVKIDPAFTEAWFMLAQIYLDQRKPNEAADYYLKGVMTNPDKNAYGFLKVAELEYNVGRYEEAAGHLAAWLSKEYRNEEMQMKAADLEKRINFALDAIAHPVPFNPVSLGPGINTEQYEYWPALSIDEKTIFFTVLGPQNEDMLKTKAELQEDFYFSRREENNWGMRTWLGPPVNTNANEGAQSVTADGKIIYFTVCNRPDGHGRLCDLYFSRVLEDGSWSAPENLGDEINTTSSEKHPSITADGRKLYFVSNRPGGKGDYDVWMSEKKGDKWAKPVNLGDSINSPGMEQSPFIHPDQHSLYFTSDGWPGMGRGDIFLAKLKTDGSWTKPENLGYPINTYNEEIGFIVNAKGTRAYFSSNRREGTDTDIFAFDLPEELRPDPVSYITGRVFDARTYKGIEAVFQLIDLQTGEVVMESASNPGEGDYFVGIPSGSSYAFNVSQQGYLFYSDHFDIEKQYDRLDPFRKDIPLEPIQKGKMVVLNNIFFDTDSDVLKDESKVELQKVLEFLDVNKSVRVEISGHTDNTGTESHNLELSRKRASAVVNYLVSNGTDPGRIESKGYGASQPVDTNDTEAGKAANRRTELKIL